MTVLGLGKPPKKKKRPTVMDHRYTALPFLLRERLLGLLTIDAGDGITDELFVGDHLVHLFLEGNQGAEVYRDFVE